MVIRMRSEWLWLTVLGLMSGCDTTGANGVMGSVMGQVGNTVAGNVMAHSVSAMATSAPVANATREICGSDSWGVCHSVTATMLAGFSDEFVKRMTQDDIREAAAARDRSLHDGQPQVWTNPQSGASGTVETKKADTLAPKPMTVAVAQDRVDTTNLPIMDAVGEPFQVVSPKGANVRGGPGTGYSVVESLKPLEAITAIAKVRDQDWYMIGRGNVAIGYVFSNLVGPRAFSQPVVPAVPSTSPTKEVQVTMGSECYTTTQKVTLKDGTSEQAKVTSCRTPNGWAQV
jgi:uncharacterized protein YgiM (DUF1202 family)